LVLQNIFGETPDYHDYPELTVLEKINTDEVSSITITEKHLSTYLDLLQTAIDSKIPDFNSQVEEIRELKKDFREQTNLIEELILEQRKKQKITIVEFNPMIPAIVVANGDLVSIPSKTHMHYLMLVLLPSKEKAQIKEWYVDDVLEALKPFQHEADWDSPTWKSIQEAMYSINEKFSKITKSTVPERRLILNPRPQILQLNPLYF